MTQAKPSSKRRRSRPSRAPSKSGARTKPRSRKKSAAAKAASRPGSPTDRWLRFVKQHGVVLAAARGPVPSVAEAIAGERIIGSWWAHARAQQIFDALSLIDDSEDVRCFKLIDNKITFVHRRLWPALVALVDAGEIAKDRVAAIEQRHMPSGEHRTTTTPFPNWVPSDVREFARRLSPIHARELLGNWTGSR